MRAFLMHMRLAFTASAFTFKQAFHHRLKNILPLCVNFSALLCLFYYSHLP